MKIFVVPTWYPSNLSPESGTFFVEWAKMLRRSGNEIIIVVDLVHSFKDIFRLRKWHVKYRKPVLRDGLVEYRQETLNWFPKIPRATHYFYTRRLRRLLEKATRETGEPDFAIVHSSLYAGDAIGEWLRLHSIPWIVIEHLKEFLLPNCFTQHQITCIRQAYQNANRIVVPSSAVKNAIVVKFPEYSYKLEIVPNPVDLSSFMLKSARPQAGGGFVFVSVALFRPEKRLDILLHAFAIALEKCPTIKLELVGDGSEREQIALLINELQMSEAVEILGYCDKTEISAIMNECHALVLTSEVETFGVVLVEAMACGLPVIATRCGGPEDILTPEIGFLTPVGDVSQLANVMCRMISEYSRFSPERIRQIAEEKYSEAAYCKAIQKIYDEIRLSIGK